LFFWLCLSLSLAAVSAQAQEFGAAFGTNSAIERYDSRRAPLVLPDRTSPFSDSVKLGRHWSASGPLVWPFKGRRVLDAPRRFLHLFNPFARRAAVEEGPAPRDLEPRAWTTVVGWNPSKSAFPDVTTHESTLGLFRLNRE